MPFIIGGAILGGAVISGYSANKAANTQAGAANRASDTQLQMFNKTQQNLQPWLSAGDTSLADLNYLMGVGPNTGQTDAARGGGYGSLAQPFDLSKFQQSPAYQFNLEQGQQAINKGANARGNYYAPQTLQDLGKFSQGMASNEFQNAYQNYNQNQANVWNRLYGVSGSGQNAAANMGGFATATGGQIGQNIIGAGNAQAAGQIGVGNAITGGLNNAYNAYLTQQILGQNQSSNFSPGRYGYSGTTGLSTEY